MKGMTCNKKKISFIIGKKKEIESQMEKEEYGRRGKEGIIIEVGRRPGE